MDMSTLGNFLPGFKMGNVQGIAQALNVSSKQKIGGTE